MHNHVKGIAQLFGKTDVADARTLILLVKKCRKFVEVLDEHEDRWWAQQAMDAEKEGFLSAEESAKFLRIAKGRPAGKEPEAA